MVLPLLLFALGIAVMGCSPRSSRVVGEADALGDQAFLEYARGSFESASNALQRYIAYLDKNEERIASYRDYDAVDLKGQNVPFPVSRDIPVTKLAPHSMFACMMIYSGNTNEALRHLSHAYRYHVQAQSRAQMTPVPRSDFVKFILDGREKIDTAAGVAWKTQYGLDTNIVSGIAAAWAQQPPSERH